MKRKAEKARVFFLRIVARYSFMVTTENLSRCFFVTDDRQLVATSGLRSALRFLGKEGYRLTWEEPGP